MIEFVLNYTGRLRKVLLCPPTDFGFRPINEITRKVLAEGETADLDAVKCELTQILKGGGGPHFMTSPLPRDA